MVIVGALILSFGAGMQGANAAGSAAAPVGAVGSNNPAQNDAAGTAPNSSNFQLVSCNPTYDPTNPGTLKNDCDYSQLVATAYRFVKYVFYIIIPILAAMLLYAGFKYMTANGDVNVLSDAKRMFRPLLIGIFLVSAAWLIVYTILDKLLAPSIGDISKSSIIGN